jgi:hypothetical protein
MDLGYDEIDMDLHAAKQKHGITFTEKSKLKQQKWPEQV